MKIKNTTGKGSLGAGISFHFLDGSAGGLGIGEGMGLGDGHGGGVGRCGYMGYGIINLRHSLRPL